MSEINKKIGKQIRELRNEVGLTQKQLAVKADIKQVDVSRLENGVLNPSIDYLHKIVTALGKK